MRKPTKDEIFRNGETLVNEYIDTYDAFTGEPRSVWIVVIKYEGHLYYSKMILGGFADEFKELN